QLDVIGILKEVMPCGFHDECADIEVSGEVSMPKDVLRAKFKSRVKGRILLALKRGMVVWSDIRTTESISTPNERVEVETCMVSRLLEPEKYDLKNLTETECKPIFNTDIKVPTPK